MKQVFKKVTLILMIAFSNLLMTEYAYGQAPQKFNYQGIARDTKGNPLANQALSLKLSILQTEDATNAEYEEIQSVTTNEFGLYTLQIGNGIALNGEMKTVQWETGNKYIKVAIDPAGGDDYEDAGTTQLLSVPYAIYADKAGMVKETVNNTHGGIRTGAVSSNAAHVAGDANFITKFTGLNTIGKSLFYDNGTNTGLGTTSPLAKIHLYNTAATNTELRIQHTNNLAASRLSFFNDSATSFTATANYAIMNKYGAGVGGATATNFALSKLFSFNNSQGGLLFSSGGNLGFGFYNQPTSQVTVKLLLHQASNNLGLGGNTVPAAPVHINNLVSGDTLKITNSTTGHLITDGLDIRTNGNAASIINRENSTLSLGTNNASILNLTSTGTTELSGQIKIVGGVPGVGKVLTSDASGLATWQTPASGGGNIGGGGTLNYIPKFSPSGSALANSSFIDNTTNLLYNSAINPDALNNSMYFKAKNGGGSNWMTLEGTQVQSYTFFRSVDSGLGNKGLLFGQTNAFDSSASLTYVPFNNSIYLGSDLSSPGGFVINNATGKMGNGSWISSLTDNAHFNINTAFDTAAYFNAGNSSSTFKYGLLSEASSPSGAAGVSGNAYYTGVGNPSYTYGGLFTGSGGTQDVYGLFGTANNTSGSFGFVNGLSASAFQSGGGYSEGMNASSSILDVTNVNTSVGGSFYANSDGTGFVTGIQSEASGGDETVMGVYGKATGHYYGTTGNNNPYGVYGEADGGFGNSDYAYGVYGTAANALFSSNNYAGYFNGNTHVNGTLSKLSGTFKIDHPQDPANKFLVHSFVESPDMMNVYNGNIITDANGLATVSLPAYFEAENKDFKYQLTVIDNSNDFVMAKVSKKVSNNMFEVKTSKPNVEVSWQVTGVRQDAWANANRVVAEVDKNEREKGKYLTPELFGKDSKLGLHYHPAVSSSRHKEISSKEKAEHQRIKGMMDLDQRKAKMEAQEKAKLAMKNAGSSSGSGK